MSEICKCGHLKLDHCGTRPSLWCYNCTCKRFIPAEPVKPRKHVIYGWTSKRSRLMKLLRWSGRWSEAILWSEHNVRRTRGAKREWCVADWPPKRVKIIVEEV